MSYAIKFKKAAFAYLINQKAKIILLEQRILDN